MTVLLKRGQIGRARGGLLLDVTAKSSVGWASVFAPTWEMVAAHKSGVMGDAEYGSLYENVLVAAGEDAFRRLWEFGADGAIRLLCYCPDGRFCHTHLMIAHAVSNYPQWFTDGRAARRMPGTGGNMRHLLAIDLETTGLRPGYHEITQIAAIMLDNGLVELATFETLVRIEHPERGLEGGFDVFAHTGLRLEDIQNGLPLREALRALETFVRAAIGGTDLKQVVMFGQNPMFDKGFLDAAFEQQGWGWPFDFHVLALESMFAHHHLLRTGELPGGIGLNNICKASNVENVRKHNAASDIRATVDALHVLCPSKVGRAKAESAAVVEPVRPIPRRRNAK